MKNLFKVLLLAIVLALGMGEALGQYVWTQDARNPILSGGAIGAWNGNVMGPCVLFNTDSSRYEMWFGASDGTFNIGFATSKDGISWTMYPTPVLSSTPGTWDATWVQAPTVIRENGQYKMWYTSYINLPPVNPYSIGYATSPDGIHWTKYSGNPVLGPGTAAWEAGGPYSCAVMPFPGGYKMWYAGSDSTESRHSMGYATSVDGITWRRDTVHNPVMNYGATGQWDSPYVGLPYVLQIGNTCYMWYAGNGSGVGREIRSIGVATSNDSGITWTKYANNPLLFPSPGTWYSRDVLPGSVLRRGDTLDMWYAASDDNHVYRIGHATASANLRLVPSQYATIQAGINAAVQGDTVLVDEGTYYENIRYKGKKIVVGSRYVLDSDTAHISRTIINGSKSANADSGSVVYFVSGEDTTSVLCGFTITGGTGTYVAVPTFSDHEGGGVLCFNSGARLKRNIIIGNTIADGQIPLAMFGAGVSADGPETGQMPLLIMEENVVKGNSATTANDKPIGGVGITLYHMSAVLRGNSITDNSGETQSTTGYIAGGGIWHTQGALVCEGNLIARNKAVGTKLLGPNVACGGGVLAEAVNLDFHRNRVIDNIVQGPASAVGTWGGGIHVFANPASDLRNVVISGNYFRGNQALGGSTTSGGGIDIWNEKPLIENNIIEKNTAYLGGGIALHGSLSATAAVVVNNTINDNNATYGGGASFRDGAITVAFNNILWLDSASSNREIHITSVTVNVNNCDVAGGYAGTGNINVDPMFTDSTYRLSDSSKCIGGGTDSTQIGSQWYRAPRGDFYGSLRPNPAGTKPDIGACENHRGDPLVGVAQDGGGLPFVFALEQNYPNPFNPSTTIRYSLPHKSHVLLTVFSTLGQQVAQLVKGDMEAGYHEVKFDGAGRASGVYFYRLQAGDFVQSRKLLLLK